MSAGSQKLRLLLVDDEHDITVVLKRGLESHGFEVTAFNDPAEALSNYAPGKYDLVLLDVRMPRMSGFELYRKIRDIDPDVKACFLTAFEIYFDEFRKMFPKLHVRCFAKKPVSAGDLRGLIIQEISGEEPRANTS